MQIDTKSTEQLSFKFSSNNFQRWMLSFHDIFRISHCPLRGPNVADIDSDSTDAFIDFVFLYRNSAKLSEFVDERVLRTMWPTNLKN